MLPGWAWSNGNGVINLVVDLEQLTFSSNRHQPPGLCDVEPFFCGFVLAKLSFPKRRANCFDRLIAAPYLNPHERQGARLVAHKTRKT